MPRQSKELLTTAEAARFLDVSIATVTRLARSGALQVSYRLPGLRGARLFHRDELTRVAVEKELS